ncbi:hypothetical protein D9615_005616 [Tricholomella constricta]|uniref:Uncharacterized protein n=1 Tax=Tricholomella constricta TaxID=117010 RepID=A0A8H5HE09_9AGAR|nr:hypothetical protein D9615_005616 [Tricholomella constricta]
MPTSTSQSSESPASPRAPISPFSITSASDSHYTSDDLPDLGAFNTVIREWIYLQPPLRIPAYHPPEESTASGSVISTERTDTGTEGTGRRSTVWNHLPIAEYLVSESDDAGDTDTEGARSVEIETEIDEEQSTQIEDASSSSLPLDSYTLSPLRTQPSLDDSSIRDLDLNDFDTDFHPSLGYLDEALSFIAAERARLDAQRAAGIGTASPDAWKHVIGKSHLALKLYLIRSHTPSGIEPRRKRRRRRPGKGLSSSQPQTSTVSRSSLFNTSDNEPETHVLYNPEDATEEEDEDEGDDENDHTPQYKHRLTPASKSTPMTPRPRISSPRGIIILSSDSNDPSTSVTTPGGKVKPPRKRSRCKNKKLQPLSHSRSTPALRTLASLYPPVLEAPADPGTHRLVTLTRYLGQMCPEERGLLAGVEKKLIAASKGQQRTEEEEAIFLHDPEMALDPRGRPPRASDPPVHVFIDHSNILFGLLTYLKRLPQPTLRNTQPHSVLPNLHHSHAQTTTTTTPIPLPSFATAGHSLRVDTHAPPPGSAGSPKKSKAKAKPTHGSGTASIISNYPSPSATAAVSIPIPITVSTSSASDDILLLGGAHGAVSGSGSGSGDEGGDWGEDRESGSWEDEEETDRGEQYPTEDDDSGDGLEVRPVKSRRPARHLSHTALALILERGRPITRRVVVTSSPLYQPMDTMERLGYEAVFAEKRPDDYCTPTGDGMDRQNKSAHGRTNSGGKWSPKKGKGHARRVSGSTSTDSAGASTSPSTQTGDGGKGLTRGTIAGAPPSSFTFPQHSSSSAPASSAVVPPTLPSGSLTHHHQHLHPSQHQHSQRHYHAQRSSIRQGAGAPRIRYREQGVDELLQLKLHQALAATDDVPEGSTIVLATGDGNVGQFNEDGFLGPVRTALKRGWRVELYAWEDGLSRAWRREFGIGSEWARTGRFQIIGMEQFAASLVKGGL